MKVALQYTYTYIDKTKSENIVFVPKSKCPSVRQPSFYNKITALYTLYCVFKGPFSLIINLPHVYYAYNS